MTFLLAITQGRDEGWSSLYIVTLLAVAAVAGVGFVVTELRQTEPFVELRLYKNFAFAMASLVVFLNTITFMSSSFVVTLFLQIHLLYTPLQSAWILMPSAVVIGILSVVTGRLSDFIAPKILIAARAQPATAASVPRLRRRRNAYTLAATGPPGAAKPIAL